MTSEICHLAYIRHTAAKRTESETETLPFDESNATTYIRGIVAPTPEATKVGGMEFTHLYMSGAHAARIR